MSFVAILISLLNTYIIARFARKYFSLVLSGSFLLSSISAASYLSLAYNIDLLSSIWFWGIVSVFAILIFIFSKPLKYIFTWFLILSLLALILIIPFELEPGGLLSLVFTIVSAGLVYFLRKEITNVLVGILSGFNLSLALSIIIFETGIFEIDTFGKISIFLYLIGPVAGVIFQFKYYNKYFNNSNGTGEDSSLSNTEEIL